MTINDSPQTVLLSAVGEALFGSRWQTDMALALGVSDRTIRRWAASTDKIPLGVVADLLRLCETRRSTLDDMIGQLKVALAT